MNKKHSYSTGTIVFFTNHIQHHVITSRQSCTVDIVATTRQQNGVFQTFLFARITKKELPSMLETRLSCWNLGICSARFCRRRAMERNGDARFSQVMCVDANTACSLFAKPSNPRQKRHSKMLVGTLEKNNVTFCPHFFRSAQKSTHANTMRRHLNGMYCLCY